MGIFRASAIPNAPEKAQNRPNSRADPNKLNARSRSANTQLGTANDPSRLSVYKIGLAVRCCAAPSVAQTAKIKTEHSTRVRCETAPRKI